MKQRVKLSTYSIIISIVGFVALVFLMIYELNHRHEGAAYFAAIALMTMSISALIYAPLFISSNEERLTIHRLIRKKSIPLSKIKSVELCPPTVAEKRICGSGGWLGYWGWCSEPSIGKYFAYYGKASDCFLVKLKNGHQYLLGCENPAQLVSLLTSKIEN